MSRRSSRSGRATSRLEISNTTPLPAKIYADEGLAQVVFFLAGEICETSYADRAGKVHEANWHYDSEDVKLYAAVMIGGAIGSALRYAMSTWIAEATHSTFPWGTLAVNVLGSLDHWRLYRTHRS